MIRLAREAVDTCFEGAEHQREVELALYRLVYSNWDDIAQVQGWPKAGAALSTYVTGKFIRFDYKHHRGVVPGGMWMSSGWGSDPAVPDWAVQPAPFTLKEASCPQGA
jgi:hypothetical protein